MSDAAEGMLDVKQSMTMGYKVQIENGCGEVHKAIESTAEIQFDSVMCFGNSLLGLK